MPSLISPGRYAGGRPGASPRESEITEPEAEASTAPLAAGPLSHEAAVPFFHFYGGKMHKDVLGGA